MANETTTKFKVDISDLKAEFQEAERVIKNSNAEFKAATAGMDSWSRSSDGLTAKLKQLNTNYEAQQKKLKSLQEQYERVTKAEGENSSGAQDLKIKILNQQAAVAKAEKSIKDYTAKLEKAKEQENKTKTATEKLTDKISKQETDLKQLKDKYADVVIEQGKNSSSAKDLKEKISNLSSNLKDNKEKLQNAKDAADKYDTSLKNNKTASEKASTGTDTFKIALGNLVADGISKAITGLKNLSTQAVDTYKEVDSGRDTLIAKTGATGQQAEELTAAYKNVAGNVVGSFEDMGSAAGEVNTRFGFTGDKLTEATTKFMQFAKINGTDVTESVRLVARTMGDAGIDADNYSKLLDTVTAAGQKTGVSSDTLLELLTSYGAPMRALGLSFEESTALLASWEKAGVNTKIAFSGMKTAIGSWGKEGKNSTEEFKKTLDEIEKAPTLADATATAIEVFGQKAGPDLADAIKGGRFEYADLMNDLSDSQGTIEDTYGGMTDGLDQTQIAIQKAKIKLSDFAEEIINKYSPQIVEAIDKFAEKIEDVVNYIINNQGTIKTAAKTIAGSFAVMFAVTKLTEFAKSLRNIISILKLVKSEAKLFKTLNPLSAKALGVAGLIIAVADLSQKFVKAKYNVEKSVPKYAELREENKKLSDEVDKVTDKYKDWKTAKDEALDGVDSEFDYYSQLKDELQNICDKNGKVKEGYEDRAKFITNELSQATGEEITMNDNVIQSYDDVIKKIDETIEKKRAEATLNASETAYKDAIQNKDEALKAVTYAQSKLQEDQNAYDEVVARRDNLQKTYDTMKIRADSDPMYAQAHGAEMTALAGQIRQINSFELAHKKEVLDDTKKKLNEAQTEYTEYITTIDNYEGLSAAILSDDSKKMNTALTKMQKGFISAKNGTKKQLEQQTKNFKTELSNMKTAVKNKTPGVTQEMVNQMQALVTASEEEMKKLPDKASSAGETAGYDFANGVRTGAMNKLPNVFNNISTFMDENFRGVMSNMQNTLDQVNTGITQYRSMPSNSIINTYNQTINAPKALNTSEIARQSNKLFFKAGGSK
jgi:TP901 family phage tail tape measure protein